MRNKQQDMSDTTAKLRKSVFNDFLKHVDYISSSKLLYD